MVANAKISRSNTAQDELGMPPWAPNLTWEYSGSNNSRDDDQSNDDDATESPTGRGGGPRGLLLEQDPEVNRIHTQSPSGSSGEATATRRPWGNYPGGVGEFVDGRPILGLVDDVTGGGVGDEVLNDREALELSLALSASNSTDISGGGPRAGGGGGGGDGAGADVRMALDGPTSLADSGHGHVISDEDSLLEEARALTLILTDFAARGGSGGGQCAVWI